MVLCFFDYAVERLIEFVVGGLVEDLNLLPDLFGQIFLSERIGQVGEFGVNDLLFLNEEAFDETGVELPLSLCMGLLR